MSPDQEVLTYLFCILCVVVLVMLGCVAPFFDVMPNMREVIGVDYMRRRSEIRERYLVLNSTLIHMFLKWLIESFRILCWLVTA